MKRLLALLLATMLLSLCFLTGCNVSTTPTETTTQAEVTQPTPEVTTPEETTPEVTTPEETTPEVTTPEETTPEVTTPEETTPEVTTPEETTPEETTPEVTTPEETTPEVTTPEVTTPEETTPEVTTPEVTTPEVTTPEETTPEVTTPEETAPEVTTPEETTPEVTPPEVTTPEVTTPEVTTPEETTPEVTTPEVTTPEETTPEVTTPEVTTPEVTTPEETTPEETTPEECVHEWTDATCTAPKICSKCGETEGALAAHNVSDETYKCTVCNKNFHLTVEEAIEIGLTFQKSNHKDSGTLGKYLLTEEYYYVTLVLNTNANANGFARTTLSGSKDLVLSVNGGYLTGANEGALGLYDTVTFKAQIGCVNSATTSTTKEARLFNVVEYIIVEKHSHTYGEEITVVTPPTCVAGKGTKSCVCGVTQEVEIPATDGHVMGAGYACTVCGKSFLTTIEEVIEIGMSYEKGKYSSEYYYVQLTLDNQVNSNGFARMTVSDGFYITVAGGYLTGDAEGTIFLGDTVVFKAKIGAVNSAMTTGGKEPRLYEVADFEIVSYSGTDTEETTLEETTPEVIPPEWNTPSDSDETVSSMISYQSTYATFERVANPIASLPFAYGYHYVKKSGTATIDKSALVWNNTTYQNGYVSFVVYVHDVTDRSGAAYHEVEFQLADGARFVSAVDAQGNQLDVLYKSEKPSVVLKKGHSYRIVVDMSDTFSPAFYFGWSGKTCEVYFYTFNVEKPKYEYFIDDATQTIVCKKNGEAYGYFAWPTVTKLDGDRLIAVSSGFRREHIDPEGKVAAWFSEDGGKTWSEPQILADTLLDDRDSGVVYWNGKIIVSWFCASKAYYLNNNASKYKAWAATIPDDYDTKYMGGNYIISEDGGLTWSEIYCMPEGMFTPHGLIINPQGGLTSVGYLKYDKATKRWGTGIAVRTTTGEMDENGFIWSEAIVIADSNTQYSMDFQEPYGIYNDNGVLIVVMRADKGLYQCELQPGATKFSAWHKIAFVQETPAHMIQHSSGVMIMTYGYRGIYIDPVTGATVSYTERNKDLTLGIRARLSYDGGLTWTREVILSCGLSPASNSSDWGYTSTVELSDGKLLTLFYQRTGSETMASIYQIVWSLPESPKGEITLTLVGGKLTTGTYDNDGKLIATVTGQAGEAIELPTPTMEGYTFDGWYLDYVCSVPFTATTYSKDLILYAKWTAQ